MALLAGRSVKRPDDVKGGANLAAGARGSGLSAGGIPGRGGAVVVILPGFEEDGRGRWWREMLAGDTLGAEIETLPGVGTRVEWAWDRVIEILLDQPSPQ